MQWPYASTLCSVERLLESESSPVLSFVPHFPALRALLFSTSIICPKHRYRTGITYSRWSERILPETQLFFLANESFSKGFWKKANMLQKQLNKTWTVYVSERGKIAWNFTLRSEGSWEKQRKRPKSYQYAQSVTVAFVGATKPHTVNSTVLHFLYIYSLNAPSTNQRNISAIKENCLTSVGGEGQWDFWISKTYKLI